MNLKMTWLRTLLGGMGKRVLRCSLWGTAFGLALAGAASAQVIGFEVPASSEVSAANCGYSGVTPTSCAENRDRALYDGIGQLNTAAFRLDGDRVCGKTDAPAHGGNCYISLLRNRRDGFLPTAPWNGSWSSGAPDQQGQIFNVASTGTGARSITVYSRANPDARYAGNQWYPEGYPGGNGLIRVYSRDSTAGSTGWTLLNEQVCTNTETWAQCSVSFTISASAQQVAFLLAPAAAVGDDRYMSVDFDDVNLAGLFPAIVASNDSYTAPYAGTTTASVLDNDTVDGAPAVVGTNVTLTPGTAPAPAQGAITMAADGTITVAAGTTAGTYSYPYQICVLPALVPPICGSAVATVAVSAPISVPTLGQWALLLLSCGMLLGYRAFRRIN